MVGESTLPPEVDLVARALLAGLDNVIGSNLVALHIYGAATFPESFGGAKDVDFHAIIANPLRDQERERLFALHRALADEFPPPAPYIDGWYLLAADAGESAVPQDQLRPDSRETDFALARAHMLAGQVVSLKGPEPERVYRSPTHEEVQVALDDELDYIRRTLGPEPWSGRRHEPWCVLQLCRLLYSHMTGDIIVSKVRAAEWARSSLSPDWRPVIAAAIADYRGTVTAKDWGLLERNTARFLEYAKREISPRQSGAPRSRRLR